MRIGNIETRRFFGVVAVGYETRMNEDGEETSFLDSEIEASTKDQACRRALAEWQELWPTLALPKTVTFKVNYLVLADGTEVDYAPTFETVSIVED
jgi:hypothetical protein